jgi:hypothetical protein
MGQTWLPQLQTTEARRAVAEMLLVIFERWGLDEASQAKLLGLTDLTPLQSGQPLPDTGKTLERAGYLLAIDRALHRLYPNDQAMAHGWVIYRHSALDWSSPLAVMLTGLDGIRKVRSLMEEPS